MKRLALRLLTTFSVLVTSMFGFIESAHAIDRVSCSNYSYTWVLSNQTTCWANAGGRAVTLYQVIGVNGGNNRGYLRTSAGQQINFERNRGYRFASPVTVVYIYIY